MDRKSLIKYCLTFPGTYEDYPFHDPNWTVIRLNRSKKIFAWIFERQGNLWVNVKADPQWRDFWRDAFPSIVPGYHLNKEHWNSLILDGSIPEETVEKLIAESYDLVKGKH
ncbi:MmcQ/YjbR family DNA-binding protein [Clostridium sp. AF19-22AC]|jgi:predicted DNA-binding protein (MmcQ/YjbR family)|uniref:MmcQ/YjbR family DNA-binding protein n=1 Tax=Clostridia TaxID=186801 RepID=UPI000E53C886|nr:MULTISPECIES: MmcQ/YjbR family DNA-binding protein [Clostridia]RHR26598.1 MmcQ/YjbR family DNA-binding protein [Clostridium sp. AF19-22AC]